MTQQIRTLAYICFANRGRSPGLAEATRTEAKRRGIEIEVMSGGAAGLGGEPIPKGCEFGAPSNDWYLNLMRQEGLELGGHISRQITPEDLSQAELILAVNRQILETLQELSPENTANMATAIEYALGRRLQNPEEANLDDSYHPRGETFYGLRPNSVAAYRTQAQQFHGLANEIMGGIIRGRTAADIDPPQIGRS